MIDHGELRLRSEDSTAIPKAQSRVLLAQINQALEHLWSLAEHPGHKKASVTLSFDVT